RRPQFGARLRVLELRRGVGEHLDGLLEKPEATRAPFGQSRCPQRRAERSGSTPGARELELFGRQAAGLVAVAELEQGEGGGRAPGYDGRVATAECVGLAAGIEHVLQAAGQIAVEHAQACPDVREKE